MCQATEYPAVSECTRSQLVNVRHTATDLSSGQQDKARSIPDLIRKVTITNDALFNQLHIIAGRTAGGQGKAQRIGAKLVHDIERIDDIVFRLTHLLPFGVTHQSMQVDGLE